MQKGQEELNLNLDFELPCIRLETLKTMPWLRGTRGTDPFHAEETIACPAGSPRCGHYLHAFRSCARCGVHHLCR